MNDLDILAFGAHPDDVELGAGGTLISHKAKGYSFGIVDLTQGELGTRGTAEIRLEEAKKAAEIMGADARENLGFDDGFFVNDKAHQLKVIEKIRKFRPRIVICNAEHDRHPDHGRGGALIEEACFYAGLIKIETQNEDGFSQEPWRPEKVLHYIQYHDHKPDLLVDITEVMEQKMEAIKAYASQFYDPKSKEPATLISQPGFLKNIENRAAYYGQYIQVKFAEGFTSRTLTGTKDIFSLI